MLFVLLALFMIPVSNILRGGKGRQRREGGGESVSQCSLACLKDWFDPYEFGNDLCFPNGELPSI